MAGGWCSGRADYHALYCDDSRSCTPGRTAASSALRGEGMPKIAQRRQALKTGMFQLSRCQNAALMPRACGVRLLFLPSSAVGLALRVGTRLPSITRDGRSLGPGIPEHGVR